MIQMAGAVLVLAGAVLQITQWSVSPYIYVLGALMFSYVQVMSRYDGKNLIIRRLRRQQILGAMLLVFAGVLMFVSRHNEWILCLSIAAFLQVYTVFRISAEMEKEEKKN